MGLKFSIRRIEDLLLAKKEQQLAYLDGKAIDGRGKAAVNVAWNAQRIMKGHATDVAQQRTQEDGPRHIGKMLPYDAGSLERDADRFLYGLLTKGVKDETAFEQITDMGDVSSNPGITALFKPRELYGEKEKEDRIRQIIDYCQIRQGGATAQAHQKRMVKEHTRLEAMYMRKVGDVVCVDHNLGHEHRAVCGHVVRGARRGAA